MGQWKNIKIISFKNPNIELSKSIFLSDKLLDHGSKQFKNKNKNFSITLQARDNLMF
jgi:hypothetical protein